MKRAFFTLIALLVFISDTSLAQDALPGIYKAGGITDFKNLYASDSNFMQAIQVLSEKVAVQIYHGFAVAKAQYKCHNTASSDIHMKVGYPVNTAVSSEKTGMVNSIFFDQLYAMKSYTNSRENTIDRLPVDSLQPMDDNNWYVWTDSIKAGDTNIITVYFIVNTNNAEIFQEGKHDANNAFVYLMDIGSGRKQPIANGEIKMELMDNLDVEDIRGLLPSSAFKVDEQHRTAVWHFSSVSPGGNSNISLVYTPFIPTFDFGYISQGRLGLFGAIDALFLQPDSELKLEAHTFDSPYQVHRVNWASLLTLAVLTLLSMIGIIAFIFLIRMLIRYISDNSPGRG